MARKDVVRWGTEWYGRSGKVLLGQDRRGVAGTDGMGSDATGKLWYDTAGQARREMERPHLVRLAGRGNVR